MRIDANSSKPFSPMPYTIKPQNNIKKNAAQWIKPLKPQ
jgi:hypothetical protein